MTTLCANVANLLLVTGASHDATKGNRHSQCPGRAPGPNSPAVADREHIAVGFGSLFRAGSSRDQGGSNDCA
jgi:hypothetical protein